MPAENLAGIHWLINNNAENMLPISALKCVACNEFYVAEP